MIGFILICSARSTWEVPVSLTRRLFTAVTVGGLLLAAGITAASATTPVPRAAGPHATTATRVAPRASTTRRILFDDTKAETAGNADWIISTSMPDPTAQNANPTSETSWTGALSAWGVALQRAGGYSLKTLPPTGRITYGDASNAQDLSNYDEFVMPEPNVLLTAAEKTAVMKFIQAGGGLFLIVDHTGSDRNNDGSDSPAVANDLMTNNSVDPTDPFGFSVDLKNITSDHPVAVSDASNAVLHGAFGTVTKSLIANGTTETLHPADNPNVKGLLYLSTGTVGGNSSAFFTTSTFGSGRVAVWADSSTIDDGTGQSGNTLYNGWSDSTATNAALGLNATAWLAGTGSATSPTPTPTTGNGCTAGQLLGNAGFESGTAPWTASSSVVYSGTKEPARTGSYAAWLDGYGSAHTDTLSQPVTIPAGCASASLSYWLHIDTAETGDTGYDTLTVQAGGSTLASYTNVNAAGGYQQHTVSLNAYRGQTVAVTFTGVEGSKLQTSFVLDDTALNVS
jgi:hypothetical protein